MNKIHPLRQAYAGVKKNHDKRKENDYYPTPPLATWALTQLVDLPGTVWEPAAGRGWMSRELERAGHEVVATDLVAYDSPVGRIDAVGVDFLKAETLPSESVKSIVTNPPFKHDMAQLFSEKALSFEGVDVVAMFCRLTFLESKRRIEFLQKNPPQIFVFSRRFNCFEEEIEKGKQFGGFIAYPWYVWDKRHPELAGKTTFVNSDDMLRDWKISCDS